MLENMLVVEETVEVVMGESAAAGEGSEEQREPKCGACRQSGLGKLGRIEADSRLLRVRKGRRMNGMGRPRVLRRN